MSICERSSRNSETSPYNNEQIPRQSAGILFFPSSIPTPTYPRPFSVQSVSPFRHVRQTAVPLPVRAAPPSIRKNVVLKIRISTCMHILRTVDNCRKYSYPHVDKHETDPKKKSDLPTGYGHHQGLLTAGVGKTSKLWKTNSVRIENQGAVCYDSTAFSCGYLRAAEHVINRLWITL